jgi:hypothetical protein
MEFAGCGDANSIFFWAAFRLMELDTSVKIAELWQKKVKSAGLSG